MTDFVSIAKDRQRVEVRVDHCGSSIGDSSFLDCEDDGTVDYPGLIGYRGDRETAWSAFTDCLRS